MSCCTVRTRLVRKQNRDVKELERDLVEFVAAGDEYHAAMTRDWLPAAKSPARLVHKCKGKN